MACEKGTMLREWLPKQLEANHDLTLEERREAFEEHFGVEVSTSTVERAIASVESTYDEEDPGIWLSRL
jgi:transposase